MFAHDRYSLLSIDNLMQPIQMQLSKKQETLAEFFSSVLKSRSNFEHSEKQDDLTDHVFPKLRTAKAMVR